ncbi:MAG: hypothetical protein JXN64_09025 [Spirochaetes bacterium]|nr:hypothetical protein [Spirochaetota bacterium]
MEFILLILINIIMGTVFYLILRLKLEKHASDYREKRLKREIDEIISEFNETAERNITILENRIDYLKKILEKSGTLTNIDQKIGEFKSDNQRSTEKELRSVDVETSETRINVISNGNMADEMEIREGNKIFAKNDTLNSEMNNFSLISKYYSQIKVRFNKVYKSITGNKTDTHGLYDKKGHTYEINDNREIYDKNPADILHVNTHAIKNDIIEAGDKTISCDNISAEDNSLELSQAKLKELFMAAKDKYLLISELFNEGYPAELICECSGIPIGEIKLVLDLNNTV